jgi:hypothetical protein
VRLAADACNDTLGRAEKNVISSWPEEMQAAYEELVAGKRQRGKKIDASVMKTVKKIKEALDEAERVRLDAEDHLRPSRSSPEHQHGERWNGSHDRSVGNARTGN